MRRAALLACALLAATPVAAQTPDTSASPARLDPPGTLHLTLPAALARVLAASPEVGAAEATADYARARYAQARAGRWLTEFELRTAHSLAPGLRVPAGSPYPREAIYLDPGVRNEWDRLRPYNRVDVEALQPLLTWGELSGTLDAARFGAESDAAAADVQRGATALRFAETYYGLVLARHLDGLARETGRLITRARTQVQDLLDGGDTTLSTSDLYELRLAEVEQRRLAAEVAGRLATARAGAARQLFLPDGTPFAPADSALAPLPFVRDSLSTYVETALDARPELRQARAGLRARQALVRVARSDLYPKLGLGVSATYGYAHGRYNPPTPYIGDPFITRTVRPGLGLQQNLAFGQTRARIQQAEAQAREVRYRAEGATQLVAFEASEAYHALVAAEAGVAAADETLTIAREWALQAGIDYDLGLASARDLVRATRARLEAEAAWADRVYRYNLTVVRLLGRTGRLVPAAARGTLVD
jgi:outer membrane protein